MDGLSSLPSLARPVLLAVADLLWPPRCTICEHPLPAGGAWTPLCEACDEATPWLGAWGCPLCQAEVAPGRCPACRELPRALVACRAAVELDEHVLPWIHRWKYPTRGLAGVDGRARALVLYWWLEGLRGLGPAPGTLVTSVPLHPRRLRQRGFQPSALLARALARRHGLRFAPFVLRRRRDDPSQTGLTRAARRANVSDAFALRPGRRLPGPVWLVDDVVTTGATVAECARVLARAGAREVRAFCLARTPLGASRELSASSVAATRRLPRAGARDRPAS